MASHQELAQRPKIRVYFADPHSPWQRPTNENNNGLFREYLPKGMDLSNVSLRRLAQIATALNKRPRECLNVQTPEEVMAEQIKHLKSSVIRFSENTYPPMSRTVMKPRSKASLFAIAASRVWYARSVFKPMAIGMVA